MKPRPVYKKDKDGTMVLSYHNREYVFREKVSPQTKRLLKLEEEPSIWSAGGRAFHLAAEMWDLENE